MEPSEPIAIVGMACRFPGAADLPGYWRLLRNGVDAIREVPPDRWDLEEFYDADGTRPGKMTTRWGGFLDQVDGFDPTFFGISPREASSMDPQQRLLLEVAWEALEEGGLVAERLAGGPVGVFVGVSTYDYGAVQLNAPDRVADGYANTGSALSIAANRISYLFDFRGPSMAIDSACSSSLAAAHLACQSLWRGESTLALAGGVNVILSPTITIGFSKLRAMAADGRCKTFDARADGYVRGEGAGMVVLKRLTHARRDGDRIHALIRGSAMNQDGRTNGLTAPNGLSQEALIRQALEGAGVEPAQVGYVEAHGTGTALGDPIEVHALGTALARGRPPGRRCAVGSVKTNIGHLEAAAGIAGLVKVALALEHREIPPSLHFETPNPHIPFETLPLEVQQTLAPWPESLRPAIAGVSSFGFGGTNVHMVLEEPPATAEAREGARAESGRAYLVPLSARAPEALRSLAGAFGARLQDAPAPALPDLAYTLARRRAHHEHRLTLVAHSNEELREHLDAFLAGESRPGLSAGRAIRGRRRKLVFVFPGQGSQWFGMARGLLAGEPVFRSSLERCAEAIRQQVGWSLLDELHADAAVSPLVSVDRIQPALWAIQIGLAALWRSWGIEPDAVVGHSMGEVAASHLAGALDLEQAAAVICRRSRLLRRTSGQGAMAAVELPIEEAERALAGYEDRVSIAVSNSPSSTVLSGDVAALEEILRRLEGRDVFCRRVKVDVASHSPQMDPLRAEMLEVLDGVRSVPPRVPLYSTVTGEVSGALALDAAYWVRNLREPVLFSRAVQRLVADGHSVFVEISPHPILLAAVQQTLQHLGKEGTVLPSLRREEDEQAVMRGSLGALFTVGRAVDWSAVAPSSGRPVSLPSYPWQRERFWLEDEATTPSRPRAGGAAGSHPLLGQHLQSAAQGTHFWDVDLDADLVPYLQDHRVQGAAVVPAALYLELALAAAHEAFGAGAHELQDVEFKKALVLRAGSTRMQVVISPGAPGAASVQFFSGAPGQAGGAVLHVTGTIRVASAVGEPGAEPPTLVSEVQARCSDVRSAAEHYGQAAQRGLDYGARFQGVEQVWRRDGEAIASLRLSADLHAEAGRYLVHPALLDACFQVLGEARPLGGRHEACVPVALAGLRIDRPLPAGARVWGHALRRSGPVMDGNVFEGDVFLLDADGNVAVAARGLRLEGFDKTGDVAPHGRDEWFYEVRWERAPGPRPTAPADRAGAWLVFCDRGGVGEALRSRLEAQGEPVVLAVPGSSYETEGPGRYRLDARDAEHYRRLLHDAFGGDPRACLGVVHLWSLDAAPAEEVGTGPLEAAAVAGCLSVVHLVQALAHHGRAGAGPRLWLVTQGTQAVAAADRGRGLAQSPLWGLGRTIAHEHPELCCTNVDLGDGAGANEIAALADDLRGDGREDRIALRGDERYVARLCRADLRAAAVPPRPHGSESGLDADQNFTLQVPTPGILDNVTLVSAPRRPPGPGQVEIRVRAAGLNFLDVLGAMGLRPDAGGEAVQLGAECAGVVTAVGEDVSGVAAGDEVLAVAPAAFSAFVTTAASLVVPKPADLGFEQAATIPIAFLTADYALRHLGRLARGERVLIHSAAGGVGLAAVQIAQRVGAEVFATAGTAEKRERLKSRGVRHVMDSRSLEFADEIRRLTEGRGVDVVLNSLAGEAIPRSLSVLAPYGRFLEIGKRDIYEDRALGLRPFQNNLSFFAVDLNRLVRERPLLVRRLFRRLMRSFAHGRLAPLPLRVFPVSDAASALRWMAQAKHVGKVVLDLQDAEARRLVAERPEFRFRGDGTYLVTGGLGGLGLAVARWMVAEGARHLLLVGRSGASAEAQPVLDDLRTAGARVSVARADVSEPGELAAVLSDVGQGLPPLRGVVHAAGRLDDGIVLKLDAARFASVMKPKIDGAWNLHRLASGQPLDFFILFSSAASLLGSPGQGNYAAANSFLDALAHHRRAHGLPALSINWGPWSDVGLAARPDRGGRLAFDGMGSLSPREGVAALSRLARPALAQVGVMPVDWQACRRGAPSLAGSAFLAGLMAQAPAGSADGSNGDADLTAALMAADPAQRQQFLEAHLAQQVARVLRLPASKLDVNRPLSTLGIDSLMAVELKNRVESVLQVSLPLMQLIQGPSVAELAALLLESMPATGSAAAVRPPRADAPPRAGKDSLLLSLLSLGKEERSG